MAHVSDHVFDDDNRHRRKFNKRFRYDWKTFTDGQVWEFVKGEDFNELENIRAGSNNYARKHGMKTRTRLTDDNNLLIQFYFPGENA